MLDQRVVSTQAGAWRTRPSPLDPCTRRMIFGPVRPMEQPGLLRRLIGG
ncbi:MAG TPA: hypothetical protein VEB68_01740 [Croceibacterium sp.]|nr:hypothetical protein [Croceibacterium sp.]